MPQKENKAKSVLYHIKNAVSHGKIVMDQEQMRLRIVDQYKEEYTFVGTISMFNLVQGYSICSDKIEQLLIGLKDIYKESHEHLKSYLANKSVIPIDNAAIIFTTMGFLSSYYRNIKYWHENGLFSDLDPLYITANNESYKLRDIRNSFSHEMIIGWDYLELRLKKKEKTATKFSLWDWVSCSDVINLFGDLSVLISLMKSVGTH